MTNQTQLDTPTTGRVSILGWKHAETAVTNWSLLACTWVDLHGNKFLTAQEIKICILSNTAASSGGKDLVLTRSQEHNQHIAQSSAISSRYHGVIARYPVHFIGQSQNLPHKISKQGSGGISDMWMITAVGVVSQQPSVVLGQVIDWKPWPSQTERK
jgi:hypothetical protein